MNDSQSSELAEAIEKLTKFLRHGSQFPDPDRFSSEQQKIQRDFRALQRGLRFGNADGPGLMADPVLSPGDLTFRLPLPAAAVTIGGYTRQRKKVWKVTVAAATSSTQNRAHLRHPDIVTGDVVRLRAFDAEGRWILIGYPVVRETPPVTGKAH